MENNLLKFSEILTRGDDKKYGCKFLLKGRNEPLGSWSLNYSTEYHLITLDEEDVDYFKKKYFPKLQSEMEAKISNIKKQYNK